jgi:DNA polymerase-3 subunit delta
MIPTEFIAALTQGKPGAAYFLCGPDRFLHEECRGALIASLPSGTREWCLAEIEYEPGRLTRELEGASQMPMLGNHSYLLFSDAEDFKHATEDDAEALKAYLDRPSPFATVVFMAIEPDRRRKLIQLLEKKAQVVEMLPLSRRDAASWVKRYLAKAGVECTPELAEEIAGKFEASRESRGQSSPGGVNLLWVRTELEKLLTAKPEAKRLERADLELMLGFREEHVIGKLLRAIAERRFGTALEHLRALLASKESEILLLWCIADLFRQALRGASSQQFGRAGWNRFANPYSTPEIAQLVVKTYPRDQLLQAIRLARQADLGIKSSWKDSRILLEFLIWQIIVGKSSEIVPAFEMPLPTAEA